MFQFPGLSSYTYIFSARYSVFNRVGYPIRISPDQRLLTTSPKRFAGSHVLHRHLMSRHPPSTLGALMLMLINILTGLIFGQFRRRPSAFWLTVVFTTPHQSLLVLLELASKIETLTDDLLPINEKVVVDLLFGLPSFFSGTRKSFSDTNVIARFVISSLTLR